MIGQTVAPVRTYAIHAKKEFRYLSTSIVENPLSSLGVFCLPK